MLLYATDAESVKNDFLQELRGIPFDCICVDDDHHLALKSFTRARRQIVIFSPLFMDCLEHYELRAIISVRYLNPTITTALLCCGLTEILLSIDLLCLLKPFHNKWLTIKVEHVDGRSLFPDSLMQYILTEFPAKNDTTKNIVESELLKVKTHIVHIMFIFISNYP